MIDETLIRPIFFTMHKKFRRSRLIATDTNAYIRTPQRSTTNTY